MRRPSVLTLVSLPLLLAACAHRGQQRPAEDLDSGSYCVVRPPAPAASLPRYTLAALQDPDLASAQRGQLVLYVDSSGSEPPVPRENVIATLQEQPPPSSSLASEPGARALPVAWGQTDSVGRVVLRPLPSGRYAGELLASQFHPWTGHVYVRAGYIDTVRIGLSAKAQAAIPVMAPCNRHTPVLRSP